MKSSYTFFILFSLFSFANVIGARKDTGEYWRAVMKDQPMPEAIHGLIRETTLSSVSNEKADCHTTESNEKNNFVKDFGPQPTATSYDNGIKPAKDKSFSKDFHPNSHFEPGPNISVYDDGVGLKGKKLSSDDFEPRPNVSVSHDDATLKGEKSFPEDFEPGPNISVYDDGVGLKGKKSSSDDFEQRPSTTAYSN
ncbi:hypothetical protein Peur_036011 [Populus x canadensis]|uniref:organ-specific protein S2-like isoform X2 n=1 Tax=Populus nigra TaxID=3691 RepID=UPI002B274FBC|nr:organ-specific protein S2-like isoform X2 [Populus nigra]